MAPEQNVPALSERTIPRLPERVQVPRYDRRALRPGIVHIGVGGFHRAHQAVYLDDLLHRPGNEMFGICGAGLLPHDAHMRDVLRSQDYLYTVVTRDATGDHARVIGSIIDFILAPDRPRALIEKLASAETRIVSLTVTEAGYCENKATGDLDAAHPAIVHDLQHPQAPIGLYGFLAEAIRARRALAIPPFTVMSCDNLLNNGAVCRRMMLAFLELQDPALRAWVEREMAFPNTMVDRITPATTDAHRQLVCDLLGVTDGWPVTTEPFRQWVIEDHFPAGRPTWEDAGAQLVGDVEPYEKMKLRLLNASHQVMCYIGMLLGYRFAPEALADHDVRQLLERFMDDEATPLVPAVPGIDLEQYKRTLRDRFANPAINDQLARIGTDGSARVSEFVLPIVRGHLLRGGPIAIGAFTVAAWIRFLQGRDDRNQPLPFSDAMGETLRQRARQSPTDPSPILSIRPLFGDLATSPRFVAAVQTALQTLHDHDARAALSECLRPPKQS